ncbi:hypothetical protein MMC17_007194 [Xylographa soralifera]|nr:hypothetical protein [Xylographa soralifera]
MDFFDWENAGASDPGELSEMLASITPLDIPASPPPHSHLNISDADLLGLSLSQHAHSQDSLIGLDPSVDTRFLDWPSPQQVDLEGPAKHNDSQVARDQSSLVPNDLVLTPESLQYTKSSTNLPSPGTTLSRKNSGNGARLSLSAIKILKEWVQDHARQPYPTETEREELRAKTGLRKEQISNWLANARRRGKVPPSAPSGSPRSFRGRSPVPHAASIPINISLFGNDQPYSTLNPLDRWRNSPPEDEPATVSAISNAMASTHPMDDRMLQDATNFQPPLDEGNNIVYAGYRAHSESSLDTGGSSGSDWSHSQSSNQSHVSKLSRMSQRRQSRRRRRNIGVTQRKVQHDDGNRPYECTFCTDNFKTKYDWQRHEKTYHLSLERWQCAPSGPTQDGGVSCAFCGQLSTTLDHFETHKYLACAEQPEHARIFFRKDHLRQHLRLFHNNCDYYAPAMDGWVSYDYDVRSRCGFCNIEIKSWPERVEHLSVHFKQGTTMKDWKGGHGFEPRIEDIVENDVPPYMLQFEKVTPDPFSASSDSHRRTATLNLDSTLLWTSASQCGFLDLQKELDVYIKEQVTKNHVPTDHEIRDRARVLVFGDNDTWNQTRADIPEWLEHFKLRAGLMSLPTVPGRNAYVGRD